MSPSAADRTLIEDGGELTGCDGVVEEADARDGAGDAGAQRPVVGRGRGFAEVAPRAILNRPGVSIGAVSPSVQESGRQLGPGSVARAAVCGTGHPEVQAVGPGAVVPVGRAGVRGVPVGEQDAHVRPRSLISDPRACVQPPVGGAPIDRVVEADCSRGRAMQRCVARVVDTERTSSTRRRSGA